MIIHALAIALMVFGLVCAAAVSIVKVIFIFVGVEVHLDDLFLLYVCAFLVGAFVTGITK